MSVYPTQVSFQRTDYSVPSHIEQFASQFADHFKVRRNYLPDFCRLIQTSKKWTRNNLETKLEIWSAAFGRIKGRNTIIKLVEAAFKACQDDTEISSLRGVMLEALIIACFGGPFILSSPRYGWGAKVNITTGTVTKSLKYTCANPTHIIPDQQSPLDICKDRSTVDFGFWSGRHAKLYECKTQPVSIGCKEIKYMQYVKKEFEILDISHEIFFVCAESRESIVMRLEEMGLGPLFKAVGSRELQEMLPA